MQILPDVHARQKWSKTKVERTFLYRLFANRSITDPPAIAESPAARANAMSPFNTFCQGI